MSRAGIVACYVVAWAACLGVEVAVIVSPPRTLVGWMVTAAVLIIQGLLVWDALLYAAWRRQQADAARYGADRP